MLLSFSVETWSLLVVFVTLFILYGTWPYGYFKKLGIPGPQPWPFLGSFGSMMIKQAVSEQRDLSHRPQHQVMVLTRHGFAEKKRIFEGRTPMLMVSDPGIIKTIMVKEFYTAFTNRRKTLMAGALADAITFVEDEHWKRIRSSLSPAFTSGRMKEIFPIAAGYADRLIEYLKNQNLKEAVNIKDMFGLYNMNVLASASFSVETDSINNPNDPFIANIKKIMNISPLNPALLIMVLFPSLTPILEKMGITIFSPSIVDYFLNSIQKIKEQHQEGMEDENRREDFLQFMIHSQISNEEAEKSSKDRPVKGLTDHEILSQSFIFILAGYDTTSTSLTSLAYNIATNPDVFSKVVEEIESVFPNKAPITYNKLMKLEYLDMVICESMRVWPPAPRLERMCKQTVVINGVTIPKGTAVAIPVNVLHSDPELWSSPEAFRPERFSKENKESIEPYAYLPFGIGPRNCIGMRYALMLVKLILVRLFQHFNLETCKETQIPVDLDAFYRPKKPIMLRIVPRSDFSTKE